MNRKSGTSSNLETITPEFQGFQGVPPHTWPMNAIRIPKYPIPTSAGRNGQASIQDSDWPRIETFKAFQNSKRRRDGFRSEHGQDRSRIMNRLFGLPKYRFTIPNNAPKFEPSPRRRTFVRRVSTFVTSAPGRLRANGTAAIPTSGSPAEFFRSKSESFVSNSESNSIEFESIISERESNERNLTQVAGDPRYRTGNLTGVSGGRFRLAPTRIQRSHR